MCTCNQVRLRMEQVPPRMLLPLILAELRSLPLLLREHWNIALHNNGPEYSSVQSRISCISWFVEADGWRGAAVRQMESFKTAS